MRRDGPPDKRLFRRARQGDRQAFGVLVRRYDKRLRGLALRLVAEPDRIDAVLKRAYLRAWRSLPSVQVPGSVSEWLYRVVYNACINELRWAPETPTPSPIDGPRVPLPAASAKRRIEGLRALPPEERVPLVLIDGEGFTLDAASRILQKPSSEIASDLARGRGRWRALVVGEPVRRVVPEVVELEPGEDEGEAEPESAPHERPRHVRVLSSDTPPSPKRRPFRPRNLPSVRSSTATGAVGSSNELLEDEASVEVVEPTEPQGSSNGGAANGVSPTSGDGTAHAGDGPVDEVVSVKGKRRKAT